MDKIAQAKQALFAKRIKQRKKALSRDKRKAQDAIHAKQERLKTITETCIRLRAERLERRRDEKQRTGN